MPHWIETMQKEQETLAKKIAPLTLKKFKTSFSETFNNLSEKLEKQLAIEVAIDLKIIIEEITFHIAEKIVASDYWQALEGALLLSLIDDVLVSQIEERIQYAYTEDIILLIDCVINYSGQLPYLGKLEYTEDGHWLIFNHNGLKKLQNLFETEKELAGQVHKDKDSKPDPDIEQAGGLVLKNDY